jgi:hypothetical protein
MQDAASRGPTGPWPKRLFGSARIALRKPIGGPDRTRGDPAIDR